MGFLISSTCAAAVVLLFVTPPRATASAPSGPENATAKRAGRVLLTVDEALALSFPGCELKRETVYLTEVQATRVGKLAGTVLDGAIARPWIATRAGKVVGTAYLDTHKVRTLKETLFVVVDAQGRAARTEVLAFAEPHEYMPRTAWYESFQGRGLDDELRVKRAIRPVTGASLTVSATLDAVRRVLALHQVLGERPPAK